ncbi:Myotubularin-related protein 2 [Phytophthora cinnamomi]|uniref:Myotubularin-related protein 2 n=1 Tax=Phytophthora cinnamomi TaxID=4785 RepID=UPI00355A5BF2|nr:Myotubularin-related protein 2 [Phytophthora cinnamomi]
MVATSKEDGVKPKRAGFALGGFLPKVPTYRKDKGAKDEPASVLEQEAEEEPVLDDNQEDRAGELPDFPGERRSHDGVVPAPSAAAVAAAAIRRRGMSIEQTATSLYRRMSVRQNSAPEPVETNKTSLTGSSGSSASPRSDPGFQARRGMCVATTFGTGTVLDVRHEDGFFVVQLVPKSVAYLREETIIREIKSVVGERVKTRWGMATVEQYYVDEDMYSIALDWRWDDEHVWRMKATTKKFEKVHPRGTLIQNTKNRLFEGYSSLRESVGSKLNTSTKSVPVVSAKHEDAVEQPDLGKAQTPFGVCTVLEVRADKFFVVKTRCGATAYLNADSVRMLERRTHFAQGDRVSTPFGFGHIAHFREDDQAYAVELETPSLVSQSPLLFISDAQAETALTHAPAVNARLSSILNITRTSMINAGERMRSASVAAGALPTLPANLPTLPGNLPTLSSVKARVSSMATIKMTPRPKFSKDERVLTTFGSGFVVESRPQDKIYHVNLRRLKCSGYFHESSLSPFPYERVTHFVVDGRTVLAPPIPKNASEYKRRAVISAAIKSAREGKYLEPTVPVKPEEPKEEKPAPIDATAAAEAAVAVDAAAATAASLPVPVPVAE